MKITLYSDLHSEFRRKEPWYPKLSQYKNAKYTEVLVLAGDIGVGNQAIKYVKGMSERYPDLPIIYVAGNHDYYKTDLLKMLPKFRVAFADCPNVHFLENDIIEIDDVVFIGSTLWAGFNFIEMNLIIEQSVSRSISDFHRIRVGDAKLTCQDMIKRHYESVIFINNSLIKFKDRKTVVITHFIPMPWQHRGIAFDNVSYYFQNDLKEIIERNGPLVWMYGHTHDNRDEMVHSTRIISNQRGYPGEYMITPFQEDLIIEV